MRVVALSAEPSLAAALNMSLDWEVVYATEPEQAAQVIAGANVVLIGGGTEEGLRLAESLRTLGVTIPAVVVGDTPTPDGARYPVLTPPFTLDELYGALETAVAGARQSAPPPGPIAVEAPRAPKASPAGGKTPARAPKPERRGRRSHLEVARDPSEAPAPSAGPAAQTSPAVAAPAPPAPPPVATPASAPRPKPPAKAPAARAQAKPAPAAPAEPPAWVAKPEAAPGRGLLRRKPKYAEPRVSAVSDRLRAAFEALSAVEVAIDELPVLTDLRELTQALMGEIVDLLTPQTAAIYLPSPDGFRVWASHGLSQVEKTMPVQTHQPLFADLLVRHEAVLIEPLDLAQQLASGVGGARTNAFLASPIEVNRKCVGVIVAGRDHFENEDLDHLEALAEEAAMGLGVALGLDRVRRLLT